MSASACHAVSSGTRALSKRQTLARGIVVVCLAFLALPAVRADESVCYGTTSHGRLEGGVQLPLTGPNFASYSVTGSLLGRTYVHGKVRTAVVKAYTALQKSAPDKVYVYGETGWRSGGRFKPHKTHQNGLSVDFMVPVLEQRRSVPLPTRFLNKLGYAIEFDAAGRYGEYAIDYEAMAAHLVELHKAAHDAGIGIQRVIFDPQLQPRLFATSHGPYLRRHLTFSTRRAWVRHDEHYHVDFRIPCNPLPT